MIGKKIHNLKNLRLTGLMTIAPNNSTESTLRKTFKITRNIQESLFAAGAENCESLSMGMTFDYQLAIEEGATHIRLGTALFGDRPK